ncbi:hypothetical protein MAPG_02292 [Magnaporthiopsis poae ATCC 64411]|uniref:WSC domain-containing protein n=1 Tax=Magnaporthiopsis poae (strain ATCC 64411 / 73-15) TaxID=644358 RepID=A0A0C4DQZ3_MAGP6|nr:hypothetical protein MAPG_02292 [Magnaporthiopsis poae ATCC 64411]
MSAKPAASWGRPFTLGYGPIVLILLMFLAGAAGAAAHEPHSDNISSSSSQKPTSTFTTTTWVTMTVTTRLAHRPTLAASHVGYALKGCYRLPAGSDSALENSTVPVNASQADALTVPRCLEACVGAGKTGGKNGPYDFVTVGEGKRCYCGTTLAKAAILVDSKDCSVPCAGDVRAACGGQGHVAVYFLTNTTSAAVSAADTSTGTGTGAGAGTGDPGFIGVKDNNPGPNPDPAPQKPQEQEQQQQQQQQQQQ